VANKIYWNDVKRILKTSILIIIPIITILVSIYSCLSKIEIDKTKQIIIAEQKQKSKMIDYIIKDTFEAVNEDLLVVKNSKELNGYINNKNIESLSEAEQVLLRIANNKKNLDQISFINNNGDEMIRVNHGDNGAYIVPSYDLKNNKDRSYDTKANQLNEGEIVISDMNLYKENGVLAIPHKPMIQITTPLYSNNHIYQGILIVNYLGQDLLNVFHKQFENSEYSFVKPSLINDRGYYLYHLNADKNFGFMFQEKKKITLAVENSELWNEIKSRDMGYYQNGNQITYFMRVHPLTKIQSNSPYDYSWVIISQFNLDDLPMVQEIIIFGMNYSDVLLLFGIIFLILIIVIVNYYAGKDKEQLNITSRIAENTNDAVIITDHNTNIIYANNTFEKVTGFTKDEVLGLKTNYFKSNKQSREFYNEMWQSIVKTGFWQGELWDKRKDGMLYPKKLRIFAIKHKRSKKIIKYIGLFSDLTKLKEEQAYVTKLKNYNIETNLPNENLLVRLIDTSIRDDKKNLNVIYFSIENYNAITLNIKQDSQLFINSLIHNIEDMLHGGDFIAQITKNNFVIGLSSLTNREELDNFLNGFFMKNNISVCFNQKEVYFDIKAGISLYPQDGNTSNELIVNAYIALENVLEEKEKTYLFYEPNLKYHIEKEIEMTLLLRKAIINEELEVYYQPQVEIEGAKTVGAEALLRWKNKKLGQISPSEFIPLAEKTGQIIEIGYWLIERIFKDYSLIQEELSPDFRISINISPLQFKDKDLFPNFKKLGEKYDIHFTNFEIEITESILMADVHIINDKLNKFKELGLTVAIDDFGTGFSSLSYLKNLNIDKLKIDRSFIKDYPDNDNGDLAQVITNMANKLNLKVITEGAEKKEQIDYLKSIGCHLVQGYYYSRPLSKEDFYKYLHDRLSL